jgi:hypothetical protein
MSDALIAFMFFMVIFTISLLSIHAKLDELDDDIKKSLGLEYKSVVMLPSLTVVVVSRKDILLFDTSCLNFIDGWILLAQYLSLSSCHPKANMLHC